MATPEVHGHCDPAFARVREAFADNFHVHDEIGASVAVFVDDRLVIDLFGGTARDQQPWTRDTLVDVFSVGKAMVALSLLVLVSRGQLRFTDRVADHWPEFAAAGKETVTVAQLMSHQAGVPGSREPMTQDILYDWNAITTRLAAETPWWEPGSAIGYHVNTLGFLGGELVRRISGVPFATFFDAEIAAPLGADFHFGIDASQERRTADFHFVSASTTASPTRDDDSLARWVYANPPGASGFGVVNTHEWRAAVHPSTNGHANARAIATVYRSVARGVEAGGSPLIPPTVIHDATHTLSEGHDLILDRKSKFGFGFQLTMPERPLGPGAHSFGHYGAGGSLGMADPDQRLAFGYCMNRFGLRWQDPRNKALLSALYESL